MGLRRIILSTVVFLLLMVSTSILVPIAFGDCSDIEIKCWGPSPDTGEGGQVVCGVISVPSWYNWRGMLCDPCPLDSNIGDIRNTCNNQFPKCCQWDCWFYWKGWQGGECNFRRGGWIPPY